MFKQGKGETPAPKKKITVKTVSSDKKSADKKSKPRKSQGKKKDSRDIKYLTGWLMSKMAKGGAKLLRSNADKVNKLNVFPVPDGDTGDNMRMTIESGIAAIENLDTDDLAEVMRVFSHGMLLGARGNSGVILSQFFAGTAKGFEGAVEADPYTLGRALQMGVKQAYASVMTPTEGTILTVAREAVDYATSKITPSSTIRTFFADFVGEMHESLERTPEALAVLKEAGVVDSGGAGLLYIMEGFNKVLNGEEDAEDDTASDPAPAHAAKAAAVSSSFGPDSKMEYGYCTELLIQLMRDKTDIDAFDVEPLKEFLSGIGNSIVAFKTDSIVKIHVHTFEPEKVLAHCREFGEFLAVKIENMSVQHTETEGAEPAPEIPVEKKKYGVVAVTNGPGIRDMFIEMGADQTIEGGQTNNPSTNDFLEAFGKIHAECIFVFPNNGNIFMAASQAAKFYTDAKVVVIPSKDVGTGYVALTSADLSGDDPDAIAEEMKAAMQNVTSGYISPAVRDAEMDGVKIRKGDTIGIMGKKIVLSDPDMRCAAYRLAVKLLEEPDKFMLTVFRGAGTTEEDQEDLRGCLEENCPSAEVYFVDGGQEIYPYIFTAE
ncbi:MAG: DAK2 domain-containing protein [Clostridia bacterium]|nr:DAK2 domain-containing protein [Clostridia bacterium]